MMLVEMCTEAEYEFLKLWYSCEWVTIKGQPESIFMVCNGEVLFEQDWENRQLYCKYLLYIFPMKFRFKYNQIKELISRLLETHLKNGHLTPIERSTRLALKLEMHLKNGYLIPMNNIINNIDLKL